MIESKVADEILQRTIDIKVGGKTYKVEPPTLNTLVLISEQIARLRKISDEDNPLLWTLSNGKQALIVAEILTILLLGSKLKDVKTVSKKAFWFIKLKKEVALKEIVRSEIMNLKLDDTGYLLSELFKKLDLSSFFFLITSLKEENLTKATKTTQSGQ